PDPSLHLTAAAPAGCFRDWVADWRRAGRLGGVDRRRNTLASSPRGAGGRPASPSELNDDTPATSRRRTRGRAGRPAGRGRRRARRLARARVGRREERLGPRPVLPRHDRPDRPRRAGDGSPPGAWGRLMNGGAWHRCGGEKVDVILRDLVVVEHWT